MPSAPIKQNSAGILVIIAFAVAGSLITFLVLNNNLVQYSTPPAALTIEVRNAAKKTDTVFNLPVKSKFAIDAVHQPVQPADSVKEQNLLYHQNPSFAVWGMLLLLMVTIASASFPVFTVQIIQLQKTFGLPPKRVAIAVLCAIVIIGYVAFSSSSGKGYYKAPKIIDDFHILLSSGNILIYIVEVTIFLMLPILSVMFLIGPSSDRLFAEKITKENLASTANALEQLNQILKNALQVLAIIVAFSVLTSGTLRETIKGTIEITGYDIFPREICYVYGLYFSLFLCIMYVPNYIYLKQQFRYLEAMANALGEPEADQEKIPAWADFKNSAFDNIKLAVTVLAPLLTSFLPEHFTFFK